MRLDCGVGSGRKVAHHAVEVAVTAELHHCTQIHSRLEQARNTRCAELVQPPRGA